MNNINKFKYINKYIIESIDLEILNEFYNIDNNKINFINYYLYDIINNNKIINLDLLIEYYNNENIYND